jgi:hypothetical protein
MSAECRATQIYVVRPPRKRWRAARGKERAGEMYLYRTLCGKLLHTRLDMRLAVPPPHITPPKQYHETTPLPLVLNHGEQLVWRGQHDGQGESLPLLPQTYPL